ncbi:hypothetical protein LSH36_2238g00026, partial [Paralvinella palmiformis]
PVVLAFNIPSINHSLNLTRDHIVGIYNGTYRNWNDSSIRAVNPAASLPNRDIRVVARSDYSGTTEVFTAALCKFDPNWNATYGKFPDGLNTDSKPERWNDSVIDLYGHLNRGVSGIILSYRNSVGYISVADAVASEMTLISILESEQRILVPNEADIRKAMDRSAPYLDDQLTADLSQYVQSGEYPIVGYSYFIIYMSKVDSCERAVQLARYIEWTYADGVASEEIREYRMSSATAAISERIQDEILRRMTCGADKRSVWTIMAEQKEAERRMQQTWRLPVLITSPLVGAAILAMVGYMAVQQLRLKRALLSDEWRIGADVIRLTWSKKHGLLADTGRPGSALSVTTSISSNVSITIGSHVWGVGFWDDKAICLRQIPARISAVIQNKDVRKSLLWMKYRVQHRNLLPVLGATFVGPDCYLVSEHANKGTLSDVIQNEKYRIDDNIKFALALDVTSGMLYLHGMNICHGRLRSDSCFIDGRWNVKVTDWDYGVMESACRSKGRTRKITPDVSVLDTSCPADIPDPNREARAMFFVDPVVMKTSFDKVNKMADVYSFAIILVEIFTRDDPYVELTDHMEPVKILELIKDKDIRPNINDLKPTSIRAVIGSAWDSDPCRRPSFSQLKKWLRNSQQTKKSILDSLMEVLEGYVNQLEEKVAERTAELAAANSNLENLLHQILPPSVADSLSRGLTVQPESFDCVTIFFSDIVGFTELSSASTPMQIVTLLNDLYTCFDAIVDRHDVYKVETIGDAYMCISGLPTRNGDQHVIHVCAMALELMAAASQFTIRHRPGDLLRLRAGIHTGSVVAGVVGLKMPRYCLFGDTVNTASRMESTSVAMRIQISHTTYTLLDRVGSFVTEPRGEIEVKVRRVGF